MKRTKAPKPAAPTDEEVRELVWRWVKENNLLELDSEYVEISTYNHVGAGTVLMTVAEKKWRFGDAEEGGIMAPAE